MFTFAWGYVFFLLPCFWIMKLYFLPKSKGQNEAMLFVPFLSRIKALNQKDKLNFGKNRSFKYYLSILAWCFLIIACANPKWLGEPIPIRQDARNIILAIDVSPSMEIPDLEQNSGTINRLESVKKVASDFIVKRQGDKLGLILFGSKAYLQTPLTFDNKTVLNMLNDATIGLAGERTAIGDSIALGSKKLMTENPKSRILLLLTDGGNNTGNIDPVEAAELAKANQIKIYTVGIGASQLMVRGVFGSQIINPSADLDEALLKKISSMTKGQYFRAQDKKALVDILDAINQLEPVSSENKTARPVTLLFYWPLSLALIIFMILIFPNFKTMARL